MRNWDVRIAKTITGYISVKADSREDAMHEALERLAEGEPLEERETGFIAEYAEPVDWDPNDERI